MRFPSKQILGYLLFSCSGQIIALPETKGILSILGDYRQTVESLEKDLSRRLAGEKLLGQKQVLKKLVDNQKLTLNFAKKSSVKHSKKNLEMASLKKQLLMARDMNRYLSETISGLSGQVKTLKKSSKTALELLLCKVRQDQQFFVRRFKKMMHEFQATKGYAEAKSVQYKTHFLNLAKEIDWQKKEQARVLEQLKLAKKSVDTAVLSGSTKDDLEEKIKENQALMLKLAKSESVAERFSKQLKEAASDFKATKFERDLLKSSLDQMHDSHARLAEKTKVLEESIRQKEALLGQKGAEIVSLSARASEFEKKNKDLEKSLQDKSAAKLSGLTLDFSTKLAEAKKEQLKLRTEIQTLLDDVSAAKKISETVARQASVERVRLAKMETELAESKAQIAKSTANTEEFLRNIGLDKVDPASPGALRMRLAQQMKSLQEEVLLKGKATLDQSLRQSLENNDVTRQLVQDLTERAKVFKNKIGSGAFEQIFSSVERLALRMNFAEVYKFFLARASIGLKDDIHFERYKEQVGIFYGSELALQVCSDDLSNPDNALLRTILV